MNKLGFNIKVNKNNRNELIEKLDSSLNVNGFILIYNEEVEYWKIPEDMSIIRIYKTSQVKTFNEWKNFIWQFTVKEPIVTIQTDKELCLGRYDTVHDCERKENALFFDVTLDNNLISDYDPHKDYKV